MTIDGLTTWSNLSGPQRLPPWAVARFTFFLSLLSLKKSNIGNAQEVSLELRAQSKLGWSSAAAASGQRWHETVTWDDEDERYVKKTMCVISKSNSQLWIHIIIDNMYMFSRFNRALCCWSDKDSRDISFSLIRKLISRAIVSRRERVKEAKKTRRTTTTIAAIFGLTLLSFPHIFPALNSKVLCIYVLIRLESAQNSVSMHMHNACDVLSKNNGSNFDERCDSLRACDGNKIMWIIEKWRVVIIIQHTARTAPK